ncbi:MAG: alpha/beta hydrolase [Gammaproteobacteria bacterium]
MRENKPNKEKKYLVPGPAGVLETLIFKQNTQENQSGQAILAIVCHPHPLFHGSMEHKIVTTALKAFQELGFNTLRFNFRGVGESQGHFAQGNGEQKDLQAIMAWAKHQGFEAFILAGFSFGSYVSAKVAGNNPAVKKLISIAPPMHHFDFYSIEKVHCPWLLIQGSEDEIVAVDLVKEWSNSTAQTHELIWFEGVGHFFHGQLIPLKQAIQNFL